MAACLCVVRLVKGYPHHLQRIVDDSDCQDHKHTYELFCAFLDE